MVIKKAAREALTEAYEEAHTNERAENPELTERLEAAQQTAAGAAKVIDPEELIEDLPTPENEKEQAAMNSYDQTIYDFLNAAQTGDEQRMEEGREKINNYIEAGEAQRFHGVALTNELEQSENPHVQNMMGDLDKASRVEQFRGWQDGGLQEVLSDCDEELRKGGPHSREEFGNIKANRDAVMRVLRERRDVEQQSQQPADSPTERVRTNDMAHVEGRFEQDGPRGYRAASAPEAELRATREEAVDDQVRWLDSPERLNLRQDDDRGLGL